MKKYIKILSVITLLISGQGLFAQQNIGIMTKDPQEKLHISGPSSVLDTNVGNTNVALIAPTIRIDGLNSTNSSAAFSGTDTTAPLYVDSNGDTFVKGGLQVFGTNTLPGGDAITTTSTLNITANKTYQRTGNLLSVTFTLQQRSAVYISSTLTADIQNSSGGTVTDGKAKGIAALLWFTSAPAASGINTSSSYMTDGFNFSNRSTSAMNNSFRLNPSCEAILPAGSYTLVLMGAGIASENAPNDNFRIVWGGGSGDKLNVFARPL